MIVGVAEGICVAVAGGVLVAVAVWLGVCVGIRVTEGFAVGRAVVLTGLGVADCWLTIGSGVADGGSGVVDGDRSVAERDATRTIPVRVGCSIALAVAVWSASGMLERDRTIANTNAKAKIPIAAMATTISFPMSRGIKVS